jgi:hypothetical protein
MGELSGTIRVIQNYMLAMSSYGSPAMYYRALQNYTMCYKMYRNLKFLWVSTEYCRRLLRGDLSPGLHNYIALCRLLSLVFFSWCMRFGTRCLTLVTTNYDCLRGRSTTSCVCIRKRGYRKPWIQVLLIITTKYSLLGPPALRSLLWKWPTVRWLPLVFWLGKEITL